VVIALSTGSLFSYGVGRVFDLAAETGYGGMELVIDSRWDSRQVGYLRQLTDQYGLPIVSVHSPFLGSVADWGKNEPNCVARALVIAEEVGAEVLVIHLPRRWGTISAGGRLGSLRLSLPLWPTKQGYSLWLREGLREAQSKTNVTIAVENMPAWRIGPWRLDRYEMNRIEEWEGFEHLTLDTTHLGTWGLDVLEVYDRVREKVAHVHLSNYEPDAAFREHHLPQQGILPLAALLNRMSEDGYAGAVVVELHPHNLPAESVSALRSRLEEARGFCEAHLRLRIVTVAPQLPQSTDTIRMY